MKKILIVEDDRRLNKGISLALRNEYFCIQAFSAQTAMDIFQQDSPDLILLDVNLPDGSGLEVLEKIRSTSRVPIILLTANKMETDIVTGLESGADDYITKPFSLMVLRARVGVRLRNGEPAENVFQIGKFIFDFDKMEFTSDGETLQLSNTEQRLLKCFLKHRGKNLTRSRLIDEVWQGETEFVDEHALTVAVNRLRSKLGESSENSKYIRTVYGVGYTWEK